MKLTDSNNEIIAQHDGDMDAAKYYYLHDRLGSVRMIIKFSIAEGIDMVNRYSYKPFGELLESGGTLTNPFKFTGQWRDAEIDQYYLRARMYDPLLMRFAGRDPVRGSFGEPMTLHKYLYCENDPVNRMDPEGRFAYNLVSSILTGSALYAHGINLATYAASSEKWKFFDLAESTFKFMPVGMAVASVGVRTGLGRVTGFFMGLGIEELSDVTGMGRVEGAAMDYWAYLLYASYMFSERADWEIWPWDMQEFREWRGDW